MIRSKNLVAVSLAILMMAGLAGCDIPATASEAASKAKQLFNKEEEISTVAEIVEEGIFNIGSKTCPESEAKVILLEYQNQYSTLYGIDMWAHDYGDGVSLEDYIKDLSISQLAMVYTFDIIAEEEGVDLSSSEKTSAEEAAKVYYDALSDSEKSYLGISEAGISSLMKKYALAYKIYNVVQAGVDNEVSDSEARVVSMRQIYTTDREKALTYKEQLDNGKAFTDINSSANEKAEDFIYVNRETFPNNVIEAIFDLDYGQVSDVLEADDGYYIFYCVNPYEKDLTEEHKADVLASRTQSAMDAVCAKYASALDSEIVTNKWNNVTVDKEIELSQTSFTAIYQEYFGE